MRIAFFCPEYFSQPGGAQRHCRRLAEELVLRGNVVKIFTEEPSAKEDATSHERLDYSMLPVSRAALWWASMLVKLSRLRGGQRVLNALFPMHSFGVRMAGPHCPALRNASLYDDYDIVVLFLSGSYSWAWEMRNVVRKIKAVSVAVPLFHVRMDSNDWVFQKNLHDRFSSVMTNTAYEKQFLVDRGWTAGRLLVGGVGSDDAGKVDGREFRTRYGIPEGVPVVLFLGRKNYHKGVTHLIEGMDIVWKRNPDVRLVLLGFMQNSKQWIDEYLAKSPYDAVGKTLDLYNVSEVEREEALAASTIMVLPSINDSFGIAYLDAWRHKIPVVGCRETCCEEVITDGQDGVLVGFGCKAEIGETINTLLADEKLRLQMGELGHTKWRTKYTWPIVAEKVESLFEEQLA